jgi:hypothetical protein
MDMLEDVADLISRQISICGTDEYCSETGICPQDFKVIVPMKDFSGEVFAIDGSNVVVCDWAAANLNRIRAGYAVYRGSLWQRTVVTYDGVFLADRKSYAKEFDRYLKGIFDIDGLVLKDSELDRLSAYFRELQEYIALGDAVSSAKPGDLVVYDGGFTWKDRPLGEVLAWIFRAAQEKEVDLLGVSKSSSLCWGEDFSRPFLPHTGYVGGNLLPEDPWYLRLEGKTVDPGPDGWDGEICVARLDGRSEHAFRVDVPTYLLSRLDQALGKLAAHACSAECLGYPHALFRAHRDLRITSQEGDFLKLKLLDMLNEKGLVESQAKNLFLDFHDVIEMRPRI